MMALYLISEIASRILESDPDPVVMGRLQRDVLHISNSQLIAANEIDANPWVHQLIQEQYPDGSWGRFHSRDSGSKQKILTTEFGVDRGLALGLDASHPVFCRVVDYLVQLLVGSLPFPDRAEKNNRWPLGIQLFTAATLAQFKPNHPFLEDIWELWAEIAVRTFSSRRYCPDAEMQAHRDLTGAAIKDSYLTLNNKYVLTLFSARVGELPQGLEQPLMRWLWEHPQGIRYIGVPAARLPQDAHPGVIDRWFNTHELLSGFPSWINFSHEIIDWLWSQQGQDGFWDFGPRVPSSHYFPLSANWRTRLNRKFDWTTRVLVLLGKFENS